MKSEVCTQLPLSHRPTCGQKGYIITAMLGVPNTKRGHESKSGYLTLAVSGAQMWAKWPHNPCNLETPDAARGDDNRPKYLTLAILGAHMWARWLHNPCHLGSPQLLARS